MVVYGEWLFLENGLAGFLILTLTSAVLGKSPSVFRQAAGSALCGGFAFTLFLPRSPLLFPLCIKLLFSLFLVLLLYGRNQWGKSLIAFYLMTLSLGGGVIGILYLLQIPALTCGGGLYIGSLRGWQVLPPLLPVFLGLLFLIKWIRVRIWGERSEATVAVTLDGETHVFPGFVDTGNFLAEPRSGKPVILMTERALRQYGGGVKIREPRVIGFCGAANQEGALLAWPAEKLRVFKEHSEQSADVYVAFYGGRFPSGPEGKEYDVLLHSAMLG